MILNLYILTIILKEIMKCILSEPLFSSVRGLDCTIAKVSYKVSGIRCILKLLTVCSVHQNLLFYSVE